jgi:hypothetical protein
MKSELRKANVGDVLASDKTPYRLKLDNEELVDAIRGGYEWRLIRDAVESSKDVAGFGEAKRNEIIQHCCASTRDQLASLLETKKRRPRVVVLVEQ